MLVCSNTCYIPHANESSCNIEEYYSIMSSPVLPPASQQPVLWRRRNVHDFAPLAANMAHHFRTTHNPIPPGGIPGSGPPPQPPYPPAWSGTSNSRKHVRFEEDYRPSAFQLKIKLGPRDRPTAEVKISVYFEKGSLPRIKVKTKKPREHTHRRRRRSYVDEQDWSGRRW